MTGVGGRRLADEDVDSTIRIGTILSLDGDRSILTLLDEALFINRFRVAESEAVEDEVLLLVLLVVLLGLL